ncbi:hypothetical protein [Phenylobacterium sp.]|uniref:hypothetical protein n=1 Tax=Phenylobacterium sp. TaxID=1871053 RepID=UPI00286A70EF|nr:hypothetical protein [Phenylobacterium sp.]
MSRIVALALAVILVGNGLAMLFASFWWYNAVPGVTATGAFNPHFVRDIGAAYLVAGLGAAWFLWRPVQGWPALVAGALFLLLHAAIHVFDASCSANPLADVIRDLPGVYLTALAAVWLAIAHRPGR